MLSQTSSLVTFNSLIAWRLLLWLTICFVD